MWALALLTATTGCNLVFEAVAGPTDAAVDAGGDGEVDARNFVCPPDGMAPSFSANPVVVTGERCISYSESSPGRATAECNSIISEAMIGAVFAPAAIAFPAGAQLSVPRQSPTGDELFVRSKSNSGVTTIDIYRRDGNGGWQFAKTTAIGARSAADIVTFSAPSAGADGRVLLVHHTDGSSPALEEWFEVAGAWQFRRGYEVVDLELVAMTHPNLTSDGRRMVVFGTSGVGSPQVVYFVRSDITIPFASPLVIDLTLTAPQYPYLRDDCSRLYVNEVNALVFSEQ